MSVSAWTETIPSGTSAVGTFPAFGRATFVAISGGMAVEHVWNGTGGGSDASTGDLLPGASRAFVDVQSQSSAAGSQMTGRLFFASDTSRLFAYDSSGTYLVGTPFCSLHSTTVFSGFALPSPTGYWLRQSGSFTTNTQSGTTTVPLPIPYLSAPIVYVTRGDSGVTAVFLEGSNSVATGAVSSWSALGATVGTFTVLWEAFGLASSGSF